jgi:hypothetical protein
VVPVRDLQAALERYRQLGFEVRAYGQNTGYGFAQRGAVSIHLSEWDEHDPKRTGVVVYLYVSDADAVRAEWASCGVEGHLGEIRNADYGIREFGFVDRHPRPIRGYSQLTRKSLFASNFQPNDYQLLRSSMGCDGLRWSRTALMTSASIAVAGTRCTDPARAAVPWSRAADR